MSQGLATPFLATTTPTTTVYTSGSGTYTTPNNVQFLIVEVLGGGGGGGGTTATAAQVGVGGSGGAGGYCYKLITSPAATYAYSVGAGGNGGAAGTNNGTAGSNSTFGTLTANGGSGGSGSSTSASAIISNAGGNGGSASGGDINLTGGAGNSGVGQLSGVISGTGGSSVYGGGAPSAIQTAAGSVVGNNAATNSGGGGSGAVSINTTTARAGGNGAAGQIVITEYYNVLGVSSNLNLPLAVDQGGSGRTSATAYGVICGGTTSTGAHQSIASVGTSGQVLTSNGAGALPTFQSLAASSSAYVLISTGTASSSASIDFTGLSTTYSAYKIIYDNLYPGTTNTQFVMLFSTNNGSSFITSAYLYTGMAQGTGAYAAAASTNSSSILLSNSVNFHTTTNTVGAGEITLFNPAGSQATKLISHTGACYAGSPLNPATYTTMGAYITASAVNAVRLQMSSGNIGTGTFKLYGILA